MNYQKRNFFYIPVIFFTVLIVSPINAQPWKEHGPLQVSGKNPHYLSHSDGTPFFWLADTGWEMLHRLNREEIECYLEKRRLLGFNVIQTVIISEFINMDKATNFYNDSIFYKENPEFPFITPGLDFKDENEYDFWDHVDYAVRTAETKGLYLALLPSWGEWVTPRTDKELFNTSRQTYNYGWFLGERYRKSPNIIWILGGDRHPDERENGIDLWRAMAEGIADGINNIKNHDGKADYSTTLMSYHSYNSSSNWFQKDEWIDFHSWGSYHAEYNNTRAYELATNDYNLPNPKPTINLEPCYEGHGLNYAIEDNGVFTSVDVRIAAYWSVFSGAAGFTYGAQPIWQFTDSLRSKHSMMTFTNWQKGLDYPGASQMRYLKNLLLSNNMLEMIPDQTILLSSDWKCDQRNCALRNNSTIMVYIPNGNQVKIKLGSVSGKIINATWFDPRNGNFIPIGSFNNSGEKIFDVPAMSQELSWLKSGRGCDWVLILTDTNK